MPQAILVAPKIGATVPQTYAGLRQAVRQAMVQGKSNAQQAVERERVKTFWQVGKLILDHILLKKDRADYGAYVLQRLSQDLRVSVSELRYIVEFARTYPIHVPGRELSWSHHKALLAVNDKATRDEVAAKAEAENWSKRELRLKISQINKGRKKPVQVLPGEKRLTAKPGILQTYGIIGQGGELKVDLGFSCYRALTGSEAKKFKTGDIVQTAKSGRSGDGLTKICGAKGDLFTYQGTVLNITDGDTLWVLVELGFGISTKQQLRLRAIDAPEISTAAGEEARKALAGMIKKGQGAQRKGDVVQFPILIRTVKSDKYDRYLADLWVGETYVNQRLIDLGHAVKVEE